MLRVMKAGTAVGLLGVCGAAQGQGLSFFNLGAGASPSGASADGSVVAGTNATQYFRWTPGGGTQLIGGSSTAGGRASISADGRFIGGTVANSSTGLFEMGRYDAVGGSWQALGGIGGVSGSSVSSGWGMSADGQNVVGLGWVNAGSAHAVQWRASTGVMSDLGSTVAGRSSRANAVNADGTVVAGWQDGATGFRQAAVWTNGVQQVLTAPNGNPLSEAGAISTSGVWVTGGGNASATGGQPWRWSQGGGVEILTSIFNPTWSGSGTGIADDGTIVGFMRPFGPALFGEGFIWTPSGGMVNLTTFAVGLGVPVPSDVVLSLPLGISSDGKTIFGQGRSASGGIGWVITIPSPWSGAVLAGALVLGRRRRV